VAARHGKGQRKAAMLTDHGSAVRSCRFARSEAVLLPAGLATEGSYDQAERQRDAALGVSLIVNR
jgi:hypothetical protein